MSDDIEDQDVEHVDMMKTEFLECLRLVERLHRRLLDVIRNRLEEMGRTELNPVQALLIYNIGDNEMTAGELRTRGYYMGSNVSYNLKKLVEMGFISHEKSSHDRRSVRISLTEKGKAIREMVDRHYDEHVGEIMEDKLFNVEDFKDLRRGLRNLERFWSDQLRYT
ncbi:MAG: winged helix DNA-binding protein [Sphingomonadales bacterium]|nr:winged helix DNA-binding protein [Sphingomonadales bacterium]